MWIALRGGGATIAEVLAGLEANSVRMRDVVKPTTDQGPLSVTFDRAPFFGRLRGVTGSGQVTAVTCFANGREPDNCERGCTQLLGANP